jgi:hypothetical protein
VQTGDVLAAQIVPGRGCVGFEEAVRGGELSRAAREAMLDLRCGPP